MEILCSGVLITEDAVLTAAHCVDELDLFMPYGFTSVAVFHEDGDDPEATVPIASRVVHPDHTGPLAFDVDLALLWLEVPVAVAPLTLRAERPKGGWPGQPLELVGWGATDDLGQGADRRRSLDMVVESTDPDFLWTRPSAGEGLCHGDSGGPALVWEDGEPVVVGINVFIWHPTGHEGCAGSGVGVLRMRTALPRVEGALDGQPWTDDLGGRKGCGTVTDVSRAGWWWWVAGGLLWRRKRWM